MSYTFSIRQSSESSAKRVAGALGGMWRYGIVSDHSKNEIEGDNKKKVSSDGLNEVAEQKLYGENISLICFCI